MLEGIVETEAVAGVLDGGGLRVMAWDDAEGFLLIR